MKRALVVTAYDRPNLLRSTLESLARVRGIEDWDLHVSVDPCGSADLEEQVMVAAVTTLSGLGVQAQVTVHLHDTHLGVLEHPFVILDHLFADGYDYVLRLEDDMLFTEDLLEYHEWASREFREDTRVAIVESLSTRDPSVSNSGGPTEIEVVQAFGSPLAIGTWPDRWDRWLAPTWDHDYSSGEGDRSGWDWNLALRVYPMYGLSSARPRLDKVFHTGVVGAHSTPEIYELRPALRPVPAPIAYRVVGPAYAHPHDWALSEDHLPEFDVYVCTVCGMKVKVT